MIRLLHLTSTSGIGGTEQMVLALARGMDRSRFQVSIASLDGPGLLTQAAERQGIAVERWDRRLLAGRFDLIHSYGLRADLAARLSRRRLGRVQLVCGVRSIDTGHSPAKRWLDRLTRRGVDLFIANSEAGRQARVANGVSPRRIITIHNGIDPAGADPIDRPALYPERFPLVAHVANLRPMKGHATVLRAVEMLRARYPRVLVLFVGRDDAKGRLQHEARELGVADQVCFLGYHPRPREIVAACDIAILPSQFEGCPVALLEAMAEARPIVATHVGGIPELVRHEREALLIKPDDPRALAGALARLAEDEGMRKVLGLAARKRLEAEFTLQRMVARYEEAYEGLLNRS